MSGVIDPGGDYYYGGGDVDFYGVDLPAGTTIGLDVQASRQGSPLDPILWLVDVDSVTVLAFNDDYNGLDSRIEYTIGAAGRYFVGIAGYGGSGGPGYSYALSFELLLPGPGDPTTVFSASVGGPWGMAAGSQGDLYVANVNGAVLRVSPDGAVSTVAAVANPIGIVIDGFGDLLVTTHAPASGDSGFVIGVSRITSTGQQSPFAPGFATWSQCCLVTPIAVGPNGDVWVGDNAHEPAQIRHYDPLGNLKGVIDIDLSPDFVLDLAVSPAGDLHFTNGYGVYRIVANAPRVVFESSDFIDGLAFDRDGYLYLGNSGRNQVYLFDATGSAIAAPFARTNLRGRIHLAFLRDASGAMTSRLLAANFGFDGAAFFGEIVEMNPGGIRAPGFRMGVDLLRITNRSLAAAVIGAEYADTLRVVDAPGTVTWSVAGGELPPGVALAPSTGVLAGVATEEGTFTFTLRADAGSRFGLATFTVTVTKPTVALEAAAIALLGGTLLDPALERFLDLQGNRNGRFDSGDFRAYLRAVDRLPAVQSTAPKEQP